MAPKGQTSVFYKVPPSKAPEDATASQPASTAPDARPDASTQEPSVVSKSQGS